MKNLLIDAFMAVGFACLIAGIFLQFGMAPALITAGICLIVLALTAVWGR